MSLFGKKTEEKSKAISAGEAYQKILDSEKVIGLTKDDIVRQDLECVELIKDLVLDSKSFVPVKLIIDGYDSDPRDLWDIPEVRSWVAHVHNNAGYFPSILDEDSMLWYMLSLVSLKKVQAQDSELGWQVDPAEIALQRIGEIVRTTCAFVRDHDSIDDSLKSEIAGRTLITIPRVLGIAWFDVLAD